MTAIILFGGRSDERQVSVATAQNVARTLAAPLCWFWGTDGAVYDVRLHDLLQHQRPFEVEFNPFRPAAWKTLDAALDEMVVNEPVFYLALHGGEGEDGTLQRMLEKRGLPFTGSGSEASAIAFDKGRAKQAVAGRVNTAESKVVPPTNAATLRREIDDLLGRHSRIVLKPLAGGSSRGLFFLGRGGDKVGVIEQVLAANVPYILEQFISGRELTVGVVDLGKGPVALPVIEIEMDPGFSFDYEGKYLGKGTHEICPANIPDEAARAAQQTALTAHTAIGCEGYSRTDIMSAGDGMYFLELNTLPGLTLSSLVPQELRAAGIDFRDFLVTQLEQARRRSPATAPSPAAGSRP